MSTEEKRLAQLLELYPRPRIGQRVKLRRSGRLAEILTVRRARDVLKFKNEVEALMMGSRLQAIFGSQWLDVYYEADIVFGATMITVNTTDVESVVDSD